MGLLYSTSIPCADEHVLAIGKLAYNDTYVSIALNDTSVHVFSISDGSHKLGFKDSGGKHIWALAIVNDMVVAGSADGVLSAWCILKGSKLYTIRSSADSPIITTFRYILSLNSASPSVLAASNDGKIRQWVIGSATYLREYIGGHSSTVFRMQTYDNENKFISVAWKGTITAWDVSASSAIWKVKQDKEVHSFAIGEAVLALGRRDGMVKILKLEDGSEIASIEAHSKVINGLIFYQNYLLSTGTDGFLKFMSVSDSEESYNLEKEIKLFDHAITARCVFNDWLVAAGKEGGGEENVCGLDNRIKTLKIGVNNNVQIIELGLPVVQVWSLVALERFGKVIAVVRRRGIPMLEIWGGVPQS